MQSLKQILYYLKEVQTASPPHFNIKVTTCSNPMSLLPFREAFIPLLVHPWFFMKTCKY